MSLNFEGTLKKGVSKTAILANLDVDSDYDDDEAPDCGNENCSILFYVYVLKVI